MLSRYLIIFVAFSCVFHLVMVECIRWTFSKELVLSSNPSFVFKNFIHVHYISVISAPFAPCPDLSQIHDLFYTYFNNSVWGLLILLREIGSKLWPFKSIYWSVIIQLSRTGLLSADYPCDNSKCGWMVDLV